MKKALKPCIERHLADKVKAPNVVPATDWFDSALRHQKSATLIINDDPAGALQLAWSAMHDLAKGAAAAAGLRLDAETHGKVTDFLACVYQDQLEEKELGLIRAVQGGRNRSSYDDPKAGRGPIVGAAVNLSGKMTRLAIERLMPPTDEPDTDDQPN